MLYIVADATVVMLNRDFIVLTYTKTGNLPNTLFGIRNLRLWNKVLHLLLPPFPPHCHTDNLPVSPKLPWTRNSRQCLPNRLYYSYESICVNDFYRRAAGGGGTVVSNAGGAGGWGEFV